MKTIFLLLAVFISHTLFAQSSWKPLGGNGGLVSEPTSARCAGAKIAIDSSGTPYIAYFDISDSLRLMIKKFDGVNWIPVGNLGYHLRGEIDASIVISSKDTIYVGYHNLNDNSKFSIIKFDGTNWIQVGTSIKKDPGMYFEVSLTVDSNEKLYFGYAAYSYLSYPPGKANIFTFDGTDWIPVGNTSFVEHSGRMSLRIGLNNELYVGYNTYYLTGHTATSSWVQKWDGSQWDTVGTGFRYITNIDIAPDGTVYTLHEGATSGSGWYAVKKLVNNTWIQQGSTKVYGYGWQLAIDKHGGLYIVYGPAVQKYDGANWYMMGSVPFAATGGAHQANIAFGKNNIPYVVRWFEPSQGIEKIDAYYYDSVSINSADNIVESTKSLHIYPNPVVKGQNIRIELPSAQEGDYFITLYNLLGQQIYQQPHHLVNGKSVITVATSSLSSGSYYLKLSDGKRHYTAFIMIQE